MCLNLNLNLELQVRVALRQVHGIELILNNLKLWRVTYVLRWGIMQRESMQFSAIWYWHCQN
jgi:hypothetical protein